MDSSSQYLISNEYTEVYRRIPLKLHLAYGVGHVLNDVCASMWFTYLLVFFHLVLEFSNSEAGLVLLVGQVVDAICTPIVGLQSDQSENLWLCRYGKRKTWHLIGTISVLLSFPFIFSPCIGCENSHKWAQLFYFCVFVSIFQFGWACVQISHLSLIPELTPNERDRTKLTAVRYGFTVISNLLVYVITWYVLHIDAATQQSKIGPVDAPKFRTVVWSGLSVGVVCTVIFHVFVKESNGITGNNVRGSQLRLSIKELLSTIQIYQVLNWVSIVYMSTRLFVNLTQVFIPLYLHETLNMTASALASIPLVIFIGSFITSLMTERINRSFGRKLAYIFGSMLGITGCIWIRLRSEPDFIQYEVYIVAMIIGCGGSIILVTSLGITADLIGDKTGNGAFVYGFMSFTDKLANGIAVVIIQDLHKNKNETTYYRDVLAYMCGASALLGSIAVISLFVRFTSLENRYTVPNYNSINTETTNAAANNENTVS